jgi:hypothetical protein
MRFHSWVDGNLLWDVIYYAKVDVGGWKLVKNENFEYCKDELRWNFKVFQEANWDVKT